MHTSMGPVYKNTERKVDERKVKKPSFTHEGKNILQREYGFEVCWG